MIALIEIPHQRPARINWYDDHDALLADAIEQAVESGHEEPEDWADAVFELADDWHGHRLIQTAEDVEVCRAIRDIRNTEFSRCSMNCEIGSELE